jgi:hypothetical protein
MTTERVITKRERERLSKQLDRIEQILNDYLRTPERRDPEMQRKIELLKQRVEKGNQVDRTKSTLE